MVLPSLTFAGGFQLNFQSQKGIGMGVTYLATATEAATVFYNPGAMYNLKGHNFTAGLTLIFPEVALQTPSTYNIRQTTGTAKPIHFYYAAEITNKLRAGISINNQFGSSSSFEDNWEGKFIVQNISLKTFMYQPTLSYAILPQLSIGLGYIYTQGLFHFEKAVPITGKNSDYGKAILSGSGFGNSFNIGIYSKLIDSEDKYYKQTFAIGIDYRHFIKINLDNGKAEFKNIPSSLKNVFPDNTKFSSSLTLPAVLSGGLNVRLKEKDKFAVEFAYDIIKTFWSSYDTLKFDFENVDTPDASIPKNWKDAITHRFGVDLTIWDKISLRLGVYTDQSPIPSGFVSPELPDNSHTGYTAGIGIKVMKNLSIDIAYLYSYVERSDYLLSAGFDAKYRRRVNTIGFAVNYKFALPKKQNNEKE